MTDPQTPPWKQATDSPRTVLVFLMEALWSPHHATGLEIARNHVDAGDNVHLVGCPASLASCAVNAHHRRFRCTLCRSTLEAGVQTLLIPGNRVHMLEPGPPFPQVQLPATVAELRAMAVDGLPLGRGVASSLVSVLRESEPVIAEHVELVRSLVDAARLTAKETDRLLDRVNPDLVYVFNGRYAESNPVISICKRRGVEVCSHDLGYEPDTFRIAANGTIHNLDYSKQLMMDLWHRMSERDAERSALATTFFEGRRFGGTGDAVARYQWAKHQRSGALPEPLTDSSPKRKIGVFVSSEDEMTALDDFRNPIYAHQLAGFEAIVSHDWPASTHLFVRSHPNLRGLDNTQTRQVEWAGTMPHVTVIPPESDVDTYALIEACDVVLSFGSTVGIEAAYWGTPSVLAGRAVWEDLGVCRPHTHDEVIARLLHIDAPLADPLPYGFFQRTWGHNFHHFVPWPESETLTGVRVLPSSPARVRSRVERLLDPSGGLAGRIASSLRGSKVPSFEEAQGLRRAEDR